MMLSYISVRWLALMVSLLIVGTQVAADERPGKHRHDDKAPHGTTVGEHQHMTDGPTNTPGGKHLLRNMPMYAAPAGAMQQRSPTASSSTSYRSADCRWRALFGVRTAAQPDDCQCRHDIEFGVGH